MEDIVGKTFNSSQSVCQKAVDAVRESPSPEVLRIDRVRKSVSPIVQEEGGRITLGLEEPGQIAVIRCKFLERAGTFTRWVYH